MVGRSCIVITKFVSKPRMDSMDELVDIELCMPDSEAY